MCPSNCYHRAKLIILFTTVAQAYTVLLQLQSYIALTGTFYARPMDWQNNYNQPLLSPIPSCKFWYLIGHALNYYFLKCIAWFTHIMYTYIHACSYAHIIIAIHFVRVDNRIPYSNHSLRFAKYSTYIQFLDFNTIYNFISSKASTWKFHLTLS